MIGILESDYRNSIGRKDGFIIEHVSDKEIKSEYPF